MVSVGNHDAAAIFGGLGSTDETLSVSMSLLPQLLSGAILFESSAPRSSMEPDEDTFKEQPRSFRASQISCEENGCILVGRRPVDSERW